MRWDEERRWCTDACYDHAMYGWMGLWCHVFPPSFLLSFLHVSTLSCMDSHHTPPALSLTQFLHSVHYTGVIWAYSIVVWWWLVKVWFGAVCFVWMCDSWIAVIQYRADLPNEPLIMSEPTTCLYDTMISRICNRNLSHLFKMYRTFMPHLNPFIHARTMSPEDTFRDCLIFENCSTWSVAWFLV